MQIYVLFKFFVFIYPNGAPEAQLVAVARSLVWILEALAWTKGT